MSPIPLGILAASGGVAGAYQLIQATTLSSAASVVEFLNIPTDFNHLQIRVSAKSAGASTEHFLNLRINSVSSSNAYTNTRIIINGTKQGGLNTVFAYEQGTFANVGLIPGTTSDTTNVWGTSILDILNYKSTNNNKFFKALTGYNLNGPTRSVRFGHFTGLLNSTSQVTSLQFYVNTASSNIATGSKFSLYGIKAE